MLLELNHIKKSYHTGKKPNVVLNGLSLRVDKGEMLAVMGKSGCGKSTLLNILGCITTMDEGEYLYQDTPINTTNLKEANSFRKEHLAFIVQDFALLNDKTVFHNVELPLLVRKLPREARREQVLKHLLMVGMEDKLDQFPNQLSGGEQQRIAIARALVSKPDLLLADEPTGSLDEENTTVILKMLRNISELGTTVILVTHDKEVADYCSRCIRISNGIVLEG